MRVDVKIDGYLGGFLVMILRRGHTELVGRKERMSSRERKSLTTTVRLCSYLIYIISGEERINPRLLTVLPKAAMNDLQ
jgi:hypothetical protein